MSTGLKISSTAPLTVPRSVSPRPWTAAKGALMALPMS